MLAGADCDLNRQLQPDIGAWHPQQNMQGDDMSESWTQPLTQGTAGYAGQQRDTALAFAWQASNEAKANTAVILDVVKRIAADVAGLDAAEVAAIEVAAREGAAAALTEQRDDLVSAIVSALPQDKDGNLSVTDVETAVRAVFLDAGQAPAGP
jgi:hypothetical protein